MALDAEERAYIETFGGLLEKVAFELESIGDLMTLVVITSDEIGGELGGVRVLAALRNRLITRALKQIERDQSERGGAR